MDSTTATGVLIGLTAVAVIVWLISLQLLKASSHQLLIPAGAEGSEQEAVATGPNMMAGAAVVEGQADVLARRATSLLAKGTLFPNVPVKIVEKSESEVRFERAGVPGDMRSSDRWLQRGQLSFVGLGGGRTRVEWGVELSSMTWLLRMAVVFQVLGLIAVVGGCWAIYTYIVSSPDPGIRWQTVQMVQTVHFLWPPFLFSGLYRKGRRDTAARMQALANNLPYLGEDL